MSSPSTRDEVLNDLELVGHLRAAEHGNERAVGMLEDLAECASAAMSSPAAACFT
jgi:hypothetical protein